ncbi:hypothetical protein [Methylovirgula sp. 4M-Z18]|uniref:hypothetical protein n=1 Tax=Methylovirgula sp. 4M-Z18 TaxID=2293567 RepID=UPI000E2E5D19|nr:hypothetical protein [Methylovirgula sp. 4M-Z18]RFB78974.1 hypothetical protein DYH55_14195 [Methylovirgula sp. 4M-Z18]
MRSFSIALCVTLIQITPVLAFCKQDRNDQDPAYWRGHIANDPANEVLQGTTYYEAFSDPKSQTVWTFTKPGHPAHPSVVCRYPVQMGQQVFLRMEVICHNTQGACDKLVADFQALNKTMSQHLNRQ